MRSLLSLALIISLTASAFPVSAQEQTPARSSFDARSPTSGPTAGPLARAITREGIRLAAAPALSERSATGLQADVGWARVRQLKPGTEIFVTALGAQLGSRYVVLTDDFDLTTLNLTHPELSEEARRELLNAASKHPDYFAADRAHFVGTNVRVAPDGVFVADRKVADLDQVVQRFMRGDIREITGRERPRGSVAGAVGGAAGGLLLGAFFAVNLAFKHCGGDCSDEGVLMGLSLVGLPIATGFLGYRAFGSKTGDLIYIYRAP
ncbi:MAG TPA: hypothetical protein VJM31_17090 [Vicinamibacterales bacterium]|nr:hypothetical protein [Vicinamibacterales bacterium]